MGGLEEAGAVQITLVMLVAPELCFVHLILVQVQYAVHHTHKLYLNLYLAVLPKMALRVSKAINIKFKK